MRILDEKKHAEKMLTNGFELKQYEFELKILAKYYYNQNKNVTEIKLLLLKFCNKYIIDFNEVKFINMIKRACSYAEKNSLFVISPVDITEFEIQNIRQLNDLKLEKIAFVLLVISKINRQFYDHYMYDKINYITKLNELNKKKLSIPEKHEKYYADGKINSFFEIAKIYLPKKERMLIIKQLIDSGLINITKSCKYKINFVNEFNDDSDVVINISNFDNFILEYMKYIGDNIGVCEVCNVLFEIKSNRHKMCKKCWKEKHQELKNKWKRENWNKGRSLEIR